MDTELDVTDDFNCDTLCAGSYTYCGGGTDFVNVFDVGVYILFIYNCHIEYVQPKVNIFRCA